MLEEEEEEEESLKSFDRRLCAEETAVLAAYLGAEGSPFSM